MNLHGSWHYLVLLTLQCSGTLLLVEYLLHQKSSGDSHERFIPAAAVCTVELAKLLTAFAIETISVNNGSPARTIRALLADIRGSPLEFMQTLVPAALYSLQSNIQYFALHHLSAVTFQVLGQLKILTTALFSIVLLKRRIRLVQWLALLMLMIGVGLVQIAKIESATSSSAHHRQQHTSEWSGFGSMLLSSISAGFAGIFYERLLKSGRYRKGPPASIWLQSMKLGLFGLLVALGVAYGVAHSRTKIQLRGFWSGFSRLTWLMIGMQSMGGFLVAVVVRRADSIVKAFATSASIVLSAAIASVVGEAHPSDRWNATFVSGTVLVIGAVLIYARSGIRFESSKSN